MWFEDARTQTLTVDSSGDARESLRREMTKSLRSVADHITASFHLPFFSLLNEDDTHADLQDMGVGFFPDYPNGGLFFLFLKVYICFRSKLTFILCKRVP